MSKGLIKASVPAVSMYQDFNGLYVVMNRTNVVIRTSNIFKADEVFRMLGGK